MKPLYGIRGEISLLKNVSENRIFTFANHYTDISINAFTFALYDQITQIYMTVCMFLVNLSPMN